jgi:hypothetical protein
MWFCLGNNASMLEVFGSIVYPTEKQTCLLNEPFERCLWPSNSTAAPSEKSATESTATLLVLGAGPKEVAIAAKRHMLARLGYLVPPLHIIDRQGVASH